MSQVNIARGMRDFLPETMRRRRWVIGRVRSVFERYGFAPLETPALERLETLTGKYGEEGDRLLFRVLKRGRAASSGQADMGLRYDLTVPLARVVAMNRSLPMPFRRYQVQPVWRADRPQRGRYREFMQCDVDTVGSTSPLSDAECLAVVNDSLGALGFESFTIRLNHREVLSAMVERAFGTASLSQATEASILVTLDKLDKIGRSGVARELSARGATEGSIARLWQMLDQLEAPSSTEHRLEAAALALPERAWPALENLGHILSLTCSLGVSEDRLSFDPTLARGLDYYTGAVFETVITKPAMGSLSGGGRYDHLVGMFLGKDIPAVGVSLGLERILAVMDELHMFPPVSSEASVFVAALDAGLLDSASRLAAKLRAAGIPCVMAPEALRAKKLFKRANQMNVPFVAFIGPDESTLGRASLKRLSDGRQWTATAQELLSIILQT